MFRYWDGHKWNDRSTHCQRYPQIERSKLKHLFCSEKNQFLILTFLLFLIHLSLHLILLHRYLSLTFSVTFHSDTSCFHGTNGSQFFWYLQSSKTVLHRPYRNTYGFDDEDGDGLELGRETEELVTVCLDSDSMEQLHFYRSIISPFIESYWITASNLTALIHRTMDYENFITHILDSAKDYLRRGTLVHRKLKSFEIILKTFWRSSEKVLIQLLDFIFSGWKNSDNNFPVFSSFFSSGPWLGTNRRKCSYWTIEEFNCMVPKSEHDQEGNDQWYLNCLLDWILW